MTQLSVLVVGGGVAGSVLAYWLAKGGAKVTVVERSSNTLRFGQGIDVEGTPRIITQRMGVVDEMKARSTGEKGFGLCNDDGKLLAWVQGLLTSDIEILRGDLTDILIKAADKFPDVEFRFGRSVTEFTQTSSKVEVTFDNGDVEDFDVIVGADGIKSKTRDLLFGQEISRNSIRALDLYCAFYSLPREKDDTEIATVQSARGGRTGALRPIDGERSSGFLTVVTKSDELEAVQKGRDQKAQKEALARQFSGLGGQFPRLVKGMLETENFYFDRISQVKLEHWSKDRGALLGDAAHAPSPLTGEGTNLAIVGAYVMAGELTKSPEDPVGALQSYERIFRKYAEEKQVIPLGGRAPFLLNPQSAWGIWVLRSFFRLIAWTGVWRVFAWKSTEEREAKLPSWVPEYPQFYST